MSKPGFLYGDANTSKKKNHPNILNCAVNILVLVLYHSGISFLLVAAQPQAQEKGKIWVLVRVIALVRMPASRSFPSVN